MIGSWQQEAIYVGIAVLEAVALRSIRPSASPVKWAVRFYLQIQLALFLVLFPLSLFSNCGLYLPAYLFSLVPDFLSEMIVIAGLFWELSGDPSRLGNERMWGLYALVAGTVACAFLLLKPPAAMSDLARWFLAADQVLVIIRISALFAVFLRGVLCGTAWPNRVSQTWLGMAAYTVLEFAAQRLEMLHTFQYHAVVQFVSPAGAFLMFALWILALRQPRETSLIPQTQETLSQ